LVYRRKLSRGEAARGRLLLLKSMWKLFPEPGQQALLRYGQRVHGAAVEADDCICVPPAHQHYYLALGPLAAEMDLRPGCVVEFERQHDGSFEARLAS
jgi:hypothetical protein